MKKSLVALAALAAAGAASAQSSVTLFGIVDAGVSYYENKTVNGVKLSRTDLSNSGYNSSRLGFRGTEDLGGGLAASFWLEAGLGNDNGSAGAATSATNPVANQLFNRRSTVSLSGRFGEVRLGRDYVPTFWNDTVFDPFGTNGVGTNAISTSSGGTVLGQLLGQGNGNYVRANNTVGYFLPANLGGFYGQLMYGLPERVEYDPAGNTPAGLTADSRYAGGRFGYANGPLDVAVAYGESVLARNFQGGGRAEAKIANVGASWDFGFLKLMGEYNQNKVESDLAALTGDLKSNGYLIGGTIPVGPGLIRLSYSYTDFDLSTSASKQKAQKFALGYVHNLSKRTALYATAAYLKNDDIANPLLSMTVGGPAPTAAQATGTFGGVEKSMGYDFGIRHSF